MDSFSHGGGVLEEKLFTAVFPGLKLKQDLYDLLEGVTVKRISTNPERTRLHVFLRSS
ncbi:MAG: hypothetical protein IIZ39_04350, partial [Blautia sp.]|nr:hypothetical protein [Blautia sp.]